MCVCERECRNITLCVCVREGESVRERKMCEKRDRYVRRRDSVRVCVCVCAWERESVCERETERLDV